MSLLNATNTWPLHASDEIAAVTQVLQSGKTNYWTGQEGRNFENEFAAYINVPYAIAVMNGTVALEAALFALDIGPGDEVITTSRTFIASASCIVMRGATPVIADVDLDSQNITVASIAACITPRTKAIIVVHLAGWPADMPGILQLAKQHNLKVIEDCAQALGAAIDGQRVGAWGNIAAFSFCQDKIITTGGEGGMITTRDKNLWDKIWSYKDHGKNFQKVYHREHPPGFRWLHDSFGTNGRMTEMQAAIGRIQLQKLPTWLKIRKRNADILRAALKGLHCVRTPEPAHNIEHAYYKFYTFVKQHASLSRDDIMQAITEKGIPCYSGSCSEIYLEQAFANFTISQKRHAKILGDTSLMFLVHPTLTENDMHVSAKIIREVFMRVSTNLENVISV